MKLGRAATVETKVAQRPNEVRKATDRKSRSDRLGLLLGKVFFHNKVVDDEILPFHRVFAHVVFQERLHLVALVERHLFQSDIWADEMAELVRRNLSQTFESRDFWCGREFLDSSQAFLFVVAVDGFKLRAVRVARLFEDGFACGSLFAALGSLFASFGRWNSLLALLFLFIADAEEGSLEDINVALLDEFGEEVQEEGNHQ